MYLLYKTPPFLKEEFVIVANTARSTITLTVGANWIPQKNFVASF